MGHLIWLRLAERVCPKSLFWDLGQVKWSSSEYGYPYQGATTIAATINVSLTLLNQSLDKWYGKRWIWKRWPSFDDLIMKELM